MIFTFLNNNNKIANTFISTNIKKTINLRLNSETISTLNEIAETFSLTKTEIITQAIKSYAKTLLKKEPNPWLKYAGILKNVELDDINSLRDRFNKDYSFLNDL